MYHVPTTDLNYVQLLSTEHKKDWLHTHAHPAKLIFALLAGHMAKS